MEGGVGFKKEGEKSTKDKVKKRKSGWNWQGMEGKAKKPER